MQLPRLYRDLAPWYRLLTPPAEYAEEAVDVLSRLQRLCGGTPRTLLELGCGGGHLASHLPPEIALTLTDLSEDMLALSQALNPRAEHRLGDMRTLRLGRTFDAVLLHDAIMYLRTQADLRAALATARAHLAPGGALLLLPDCVAESFEADTQHGGTDAPDGRGLRYLEWVHPPEPGETWFTADFVIALRAADGSTSVVVDRHVYGLFPRETWERVLGEVGFREVRCRLDGWRREIFEGRG